MRRAVVVSPSWAALYRQTHIPAGVRVGTVVHLSGHTGETADGVFPPEPQAQIR